MHFEGKFYLNAAVAWVSQLLSSDHHTATEVEFLRISTEWIFCFLISCPFSTFHMGWHPLVFMCDFLKFYCGPVSIFLLQLSLCEIWVLALILFSVLVVLIYLEGKYYLDSNSHNSNFCLSSTEFRFLIEL